MTAAQPVTAPTAPEPARQAPAAPTMLQLLGFVFASSDMVVEIAADGRVTFATGASQRLLGRAAETLVGQPWRAFLDPADADLVDAAIQGLNAGERRGPFRVGLAGSQAVQPAMLSLFQMPQRGGTVAASISLAAPNLAAVPVDAAGLARREDFETAAAGLLKHAERNGAQLHVDLLEFAGLAAALAAMEPAAADAARRKLGAMLQSASYGGLPAADLGADRFALLRSGKGSVEALAERVRAFAGAQVQLSSGELALNAASAAESLRAIRYALDRCIEEGPPLAAQSFEAALRQTVTESARFKEVLKTGRFELVYQPVVNLKTRGLHHYEALTRFEDGGGPAATIRLAEELGLVVELDMAVVRTVVAALCETSAEIRVAANISAFSLQHPGFVDDVLKATAITPKLRPRLMLELTESHKLSDLPAANDLIQRLRTAGHVVCLDDFGAGAASLDYLRQLEADIVKFDGRFVQGLQNPRDATMLRRLAEMCHELKVSTVAEMIETEDVARRATELGVELGQGWLFGKPVAKPVALPPRPPPMMARRRGESETWQ